MNDVRSDATVAWRTLLPRFTLETAAPTVPDPVGALADHDAALAGANLDGFLRAAASPQPPLTIVVNDGHRFTDTRGFLDVLFARGRVQAPAVRVLVAAGSHQSTAAERSAHEARILGPWARRLTEIAWHDARDARTHARVGGHVLHRWMAERGAYLACGSMEPHYFAGVTGAHKTLTVGVMSLESLTANHAGALSGAAGPLRLDTNPVHAGIVAALADLERSGARLLALNQLVIGGRVRGCTAGPPLEALAAGVDAVRSAFTFSVPAPVDLVIARVTPPLDRDLYQADKGIKNTEAAVRDGGVLLLEAACPHGVGLDHFLGLLRAATTHDAARAVVEARGYRLGDHKAVRLRALTDTRRVAIGLVSNGVDPALAPVLGMRVFPDRARAAAWAATRLPEAGAGVVAEDAGNLALGTRSPRLGS